MKFFGQYLVEEGVIDEVAMLTVLNIQRRRHQIPLGEIAMQKKLLTAPQTFEILNKQITNNSLFGEEAVQLGFLTQEQVTKLIHIQKKIRGTIGSILIESGVVDEETLEHHYMLFTQKYKSGDQSDAGHLPFEHEDEAAEDLPYADDLTMIEVECPVCEEQSNYSIIPQHVFEILAHDVDLKPCDTVRADDKTTEIHPEFYSVLQCPSCTFCSYKDFFMAPFEEVTLSPYNFKKRLKAAMNKDEIASLDSSIIGEFTSVEEKQFFLLVRTIKLLELVPQIERKDSLPLAKAYHHLAWYVRDHDERDILKLAATLSHDFPTSDFFTETNLLTMACHYYRTAYYDSPITTTGILGPVILQIIARILVHMKEFREAAEMLKESTYVSEQKISELNDQLENEELPDEMKTKIADEKNEMTQFIIESVELFEHIPSEFQ